MSELQQRAVTTALTRPISIITGGPGTGKTTSVRAIVELAAAKGVEIALCAPTGRAAKRLEAMTGAPAMTIHRLLKLGGDPALKHNRENPLPCALLLIDEASMCDVALFAQLLAALSPTASLCIVGDADQLPSVGPGAVLSDLIASASVPTTRLVTIFRQRAGSSISVAAQDILVGKWPTFDRECRLIETSDSALETQDERTARWTVDAVQRLHQYGIPYDQIQVITPMRKGPLGTITLNRRLQEAINPAMPGRDEVTIGDRIFRAGDRLMQIRNDHDTGLMNGDILQLVAFDATTARAIVKDDDGYSLELTRDQLGDLLHAYASTIHKCQGGEYRAVVLPLCMGHYVMLHRNLVYTGLTRAKRHAIFIGSAKALRIAISTKTTSKRLTTLAHQLTPSVHHATREELCSTF